MTLRHFKIFVSLCDTMNMTKAAEKLFMSQSAVSQAIAELEKNYNVKLFERLSKKLYITKAGEMLLGYARHIIKMDTEAEAKMKTHSENGIIRLGASVTIASHILPQMVSQYKKENPLTDIEVVEDNTEKIEKLILNDDIDIGLVEGETTSPEIISDTFMDDELVLICSSAHRFASLAAIEPKELENEPFIIREKGSGTRKTFENVMVANNLSFKATWICNNADTIKMAVAEGLGVSIISALTVKNEVKFGLICQKNVSGIQFNRQFKIIYHKNKYLSQNMNKLISRIKSS